MASLIFWFLLVVAVLWLLAVLGRISSNTDRIRHEFQKTNEELALLRESLRPPTSEMPSTSADGWEAAGRCKVCGRSDGGHSSACIEHRERTK
jgi:hypothetical protein